MRHISLFLSFVFCGVYAADMPMPNYLKVPYYANRSYDLVATDSVKIPISSKTTPVQLEQKICNKTNSTGYLKCGGRKIACTTLGIIPIYTIVSDDFDGDFEGFISELTFEATDQEPLPLLSISEKENIR